MLDLIIKSGRVVTPPGADVMDVGVEGDTIVAVGWPDKGRSGKSHHQEYLEHLTTWVLKA